MEENELKKFDNLDTEKLTDTLGGHRHSKYYDAGHYAGKAVQALGVGIGIAAGIATLFVAKNTNGDK